MTVATIQAGSPFVPRLLTVADLAALPSELPSGPALYELDNGRLIIMAPPGDTHGATETKFVAALYNQGEARGHGKVRCGEVGVVLWRHPDRVVGADILFVANSSLPIRHSKEGYLETIPDLVIEIRSKNDSVPEIMDKVKDYLTAGVRAVCVADPENKIVTEHRRGQEAKVYTEADTLTIEDIIPGFQLAVRDVFQP